VSGPAPDPGAGLTAAQRSDFDLLFPGPGQEPLEERKVGRYKLRMLRRDEHELARAFFREHGDQEISEEVWDWRFYSRNPELFHMPMCFDDQDRLVGLYPSVLRPARMLGRDMMVCQVCRTLTHPDFRYGGRIFGLMGRMTVDRGWQNGFPLAFGGGANEIALKAGARLIGYGLMVRLETFQRRLSLRLALNRRAGAAGSLAAKLIDPLTNRDLRKSVADLEVETVSAVGEEFDELWQRKRDLYKVLIRRDARELDWRWIRCPVKTNLLAARKGGTLEGYAAYRHYEENGVRFTVVLDLFTGPGCDFLQFAPAPGSVGYELAQQTPWKQAAKEQDIVIVQALCHDADAIGLGDEIRAAEIGSNWHYCQGDSDFMD